MYKVLILMLLLFLSGVAGCIFSMNDTYDKGTGETYTVTGTFKDKDGNPIGSRNVTLKGKSNSMPDVTDSNGKYNFENVVPGSYTVTPASSIHNALSKEIEVKDSNITNVDFTCTGCHWN